MPELPEVETIRSCLDLSVTGRAIEDVWVKKGSRLLRDTVGPAALKRGLKGQKIEGLGRRGKYLILALSSGKFLVVHLGMTGCLFEAPKDKASPVHAHLRLFLDQGDLILEDPRTFGRVFLVDSGGLAELPALAKLGPEPFDQSFNAEDFGRALARRKTPLKAALLDQSVVAGLGNIYVDETCHRAGVSPLRRADRLNAAELKALHGAIRRVLRQSIKLKGTTIRDYRWADGMEGGFMGKLRVYGRGGEPCRFCGTEIIRTVVGGRSTFYCPRCQK